MGKKNSEKSQRLAQQQRKRDQRAARREIRRQKQHGQCYSEENSLKQQLSSLHLKVRDITGDGNCLFRALADQLEGHESNHMKYRQQVVEYMMRHRHDFEPFMLDNVSFDKHIQLLSDEGTFAGNDALVAFARYHRLTIVIHQLNKPCWQIEGTDMQGADAACELHISYHDFEHYSSVRKMKDNNPHGPANIKLKQLKCDNDNDSSSSSIPKQNKKKAMPVNNMTHKPCHNSSQDKDGDAMLLNEDEVSSSSYYSLDVNNEFKDSTQLSHNRGIQSENIDQDVSANMRSSTDTTLHHKYPKSGLDDVEQPNEIELEVMQLSNCLDINLIRKALHEHNYNLNDTIAYIIQITEVAEHREQDVQSKQLDVQNKEDRIARDNIEKPQPKSIKASGKGRPTNHRQSNKHLSNRRRKELAKKERIKRRDERKINNATVLSSEQNQTSDLPNNLQTLHI